MFAVGRLGSYISQGVYTVSGPFHPFGGAVDIIVVEQPDGSFKSSPWYVRFGKFQGVLKATEKVVSINVNGVDANFNMYLDHKGEAYFVREVDAAEGELESYHSSGDEVDLKSDLWRTQKSKSCNFDANRTDFVSELEASNPKILARTTSRRSKIFGLAIGRRSMKESSFREEEDAVREDRATSLERAEIAADLLEVRWTTNIDTSIKYNPNSPRLSNPKSPVAGEVRVENEASVRDSSMSGHDVDKVDSSVSLQGNIASNAPGCQQLICSYEETDVEIPCSMNPGNYTETYSSEKTTMEVDFPSPISEISARIDNGNIDKDSLAQSNGFEVAKSILKVPCTLDTEPTEGCVSSGEEHSDTGNVSQEGSITGTGNRIDEVKSTIYPDTIVGLCGCNDSLPICGEAHRELKDRLSLISLDPVLTATTTEMDKKEDIIENGSLIEDENRFFDSVQGQLEDNIVTSSLPNTGEELSEVCDLKKEIGEIVPSEKVLNLENSTTVEACNCVSGSINELSADALNSCTKNVNSLPPVSDKESFVVDMGGHARYSAGKQCSNGTPSEDSEEDQFTFSDLDDPKVEKIEGIESLPLDGGKEECLFRDSPESSEEELTETIIRDVEPHQVKDKPLQDDFVDRPSPKVKPNGASSPISISNAHNNADVEFFAPVGESLPIIRFAGDNLNPDGIAEPLSRSLDSNIEALKIANTDVQVSSASGATQQQVAHEQLAANSSELSEEIRKIVSDPAVELSLCRHLLYEGMGYEAAALAFDAEKLDMDKLTSFGSDIVKDDKLVVRIGGLYFPWNAALPIASAIGSQGREQILEPTGMIAVGQVDKTSEEVPQKSMNSRNGSWWPFSFKRSNSMKDRNFVSKRTSENPIQKNGNVDVAGTKVTKKKIRIKVPTSDQLASLNLKEGKNVVTFKFSTAMLGDQQVDARIFLWKWNTRIVISDVDGTITKSDVLGQFMPLMGIDWSQTGVTHLFSAIKENGYNLLFLSARSISQAYHTRQFLVNLKQDGKVLPEGPVVISPDGLFPSLYREVIRRAPHEFKISCLEDIKELYPRDHNPFYAGFGNRDTDELSYLKVGIPKGKIFTINPKGEVVVNRRVDTKSYTKLHVLVHDMFPPTTVTEQEDYNSWNFWRIPPPDVTI